MQSSPFPCYLVPVVIKYLPQHPVLEHTLAYVPPGMFYWFTEAFLLRKDSELYWPSEHKRKLTKLWIIKGRSCHDTRVLVCKYIREYFIKA